MACYVQGPTHIDVYALHACSGRGCDNGLRGSYRCLPLRLPHVHAHVHAHTCRCKQMHASAGAYAHARVICTCHMHMPHATCMQSLGVMEVRGAQVGSCVPSSLVWPVPAPPTRNWWGALQPSRFVHPIQRMSYPIQFSSGVSNVEPRVQHYTSVCVTCLRPSRRPSPFSNVLLPQR